MGKGAKPGEGAVARQRRMAFQPGAGCVGIRPAVEQALFGVAAQGFEIRPVRVGFDEPGDGDETGVAAAAPVVEPVDDRPQCLVGGLGGRCPRRPGVALRCRVDGAAPCRDVAVAQRTGGRRRGEAGDEQPCGAGNQQEKGADGHRNLQAAASDQFTPKRPVRPFKHDICLKIR